MGLLEQQQYVNEGLCRCAVVQPALPAKRCASTEDWVIDLTQPCPFSANGGARCPTVERGKATKFMQTSVIRSGCGGAAVERGTEGRDAAARAAVFRTDIGRIICVELRELRWELRTALRSKW